MGFSFGVSVFPIIIAALVSFFAGWIWYSRPVFGSLWLRELYKGKPLKKNTEKKSMGVQMSLGFMSQLIMAGVLAFFISLAGAAGVWGGIALGFWVWLGFVVTIGASQLLWEGKSLAFFLVNASYWLCALMIQGAIIGFLR